jgi:C4-dicarboxylate-specific signal transduction histidine kinase
MTKTTSMTTSKGMRTSAKVIAVALSASLFLSACQTTSTTNANGEPLTPAEIRMREQASTYNSTIAEGALAGCVAGGLLGLLVGGKRGVANAAIGCAVGGALGAGAGAYVADKQETYANREQQIAAMTADVQADNERLEALIESTRQVIAQDTARIKQTEQQLAAGKITMEQAKAKMASVDANKEYLDQTIAGLNDRRKTYQDAADQMANSGKSRDLRAMEKEIAQLEDQIAMLETERDSLAQRRTVSRIG